MRDQDTGLRPLAALGPQAPLRARSSVPRPEFRVPGPESGFTLLEVMVAFALIVVIVFAAVLTQSQGLVTSVRDRDILIATELAKNLINQEELKREGQNFDTLEDKENGTFETNSRFKWTIEYAKVDFSALTDLIAKEQAKQQKDGEADAENSQQTATVMRVFKDYLEKSVRRMKVTIEWTDGKGTSNQTFTELLVDYDQEFNISM